jgi:hypothetical protein
MRLAVGLVAAGLAAVFGGQAGAQTSQATMPQRMTMPGMKMPVEGPAHFAPTRAAFTANHQFLVKLVGMPQPIPYEKYFELRFAVYDGHHPAKPLKDAAISVETGMRHGLAHGFAHGMQSAPKITDNDGEFTLSGMYFHMMGPWVVKLTVRQGGKQGIAYFRLPCCGA